MTLRDAQIYTNLRHRVKQYNIEAPDRGTTLVKDLWREIVRLQTKITKLKARKEPSDA